MSTFKTNVSVVQDPIFVVGYPRSGTTLLQALLATQGDLVTFPETHFFSTVFADSTGFHQTISLDSIDSLIQTISNKSHIVFDINFVESLKRKGDHHGVFIKDIFEAIALHIITSSGKGNLTGRWLEKTPKHCLYMDFIRHVYPDAKFVGIIRNPFFAIYSRTKHFPPKTKDILKTLALEWVQYSDIFEQFKDKYPGNAFMVKYEDLINSPEKTIEKTCTFLNIDFASNLLSKYHEKADSIIMPFEYWKNGVKSAEINCAHDKTKNPFSAQDVLKIQSIVQKTMTRYGYKGQYKLWQKFYNVFRPVL